MEVKKLRPSPAQRKKILTVIFITVFIDLVGFGIVIPLSPFLATRFGAGGLEVGLLMTVYSGMQFLFSPFWGRLSDRKGRRPIILLSLLGVALGHLLFSFSTSFTLLVVARVLAGIFGANISTAMACIADITAEEDRSKSMGLIGAAFGLGFILGPALGALFGYWGALMGGTPPLGPSFAALGASLLCLANFIFACFYFPETRSAQPPVRKSRRELILGHLARPVVGHLLLLFFISSLGMAHMEATLFLYVKDVFHWNQSRASLSFAYIGLVMVFTQGYLIRRWLPVWGEKRLLPLGLGLASSGLLIIAMSTELWLLALAVTCLGLGVGLSNPSLSGSLSLKTSAAEQGEVLGVAQSLSALGRIVGPASGGYVYDQLSKSSPFMIASLLFFLGLLVFWRIQSDLPGKSRLSLSGR